AALSPLTLTPFPYTTLFRSTNAPQIGPPGAKRRPVAELSRIPRRSPTRKARRIRLWRWRMNESRYGICGDPARRHDFLLLFDVRSEEHTSELQSLTNLVCRL